MTKRAGIRIGIVGGGFMGRRHAETVSRAAAFDLAGVADPYSHDLADARGVAAFATHGELLNAGLDAVIVANPNAAHVQTTLDAHAAGIPVLVEKPLSTSTAALQPLLDLDGGAPILVGHHRRHHPAVAAAREAVESGVIGDIVTIAGIWVALKSEEYFAPAWRRAPGAGVVLINAVHDLDLFRSVFGEIASVRAQYSRRHRGLPVPDTASVAFETVDGALGTYVCSDSAVSPWTWDQATRDEEAFPFTPDASSYFVAGTKGSLTFPQLLLHRHAGVGDWNHPLSAEYLSTGPGDSYTRQIDHFAEVVRGESAPLVSVSDVADTMRLIDAVEESAGTGATVFVKTGEALAAAAQTTRPSARSVN